MNRRNFLGLLAAVPGLGWLKPKPEPEPAVEFYVDMDFLLERMLGDFEYKIENSIAARVETFKFSGMTCQRRTPSFRVEDGSLVITHESLEQT